MDEPHRWTDHPLPRFGVHGREPSDPLQKENIATAMGIVHKIRSTRTMGKCGSIDLAASTTL